MHPVILEELHKLENENEVNILYACESGSRAWGFPSPDSDYDVRFVYSQSIQKYLSIFDRRDAIDLFLAEDLDFIGWDIRKFLRLFWKSNASPFEWMQSEIIYQQKTAFIDELKKLAPDYFSPRTAMQHYLGLTGHTFKGYLQNKRVNIKKYFYALRPLLAALWIKSTHSIPPIELQKLLPVIAQDQELHEQILRLLAKKTEVEEKDNIDAVPYLQQFIARELENCEQYAQTLPKLIPDVEKLNELFRAVIK